MLASKKVFMYGDNGIGPEMLQILRKKYPRDPVATIRNQVSQANLPLIYLSGRFLLSYCANKLYLFYFEGFLWAACQQCITLTVQQIGIGKITGNIKSSRQKKALIKSRLVVMSGLEPPTHGFSVRCSTN